ncbi:hypothetical protein BVX95_01760 [archaeon D22]|nr:hypothetical protein BVX95_01760 [archaeon D22]
MVMIGKSSRTPEVLSLEEMLSFTKLRQGFGKVDLLGDTDEFFFSEGGVKSVRIPGKGELDELKTPYENLVHQITGLATVAKDVEHYQGADIIADAVLSVYNAYFAIESGKVHEANQFVNAAIRKSQDYVRDVMKTFPAYTKTGLVLGDINNRLDILTKIFDSAEASTGFESYKGDTAFKFLQECGNVALSYFKASKAQNPALETQILEYQSQMPAVLQK